MLIKIYLSLLALSMAAMGFFTLYSWSWLGSIGLPAGAIAGYEYHARASWPVLWLSASILLVLANSILWVTGRLWPMWTTLLYFQIFVLIRAFWLDPALLSFKNASGIADSTFTVAPILAAVLIMIAAAIVFFDQFLILRMKDKTYPAIEPESIGSEAENAISEPLEDKNPRYE
ncbi:hypothetical protein BH20ACI2_BH20ACI2_04750 [soil metagenome]